jgi:hypothetical protein
MPLESNKVGNKTTLIRNTSPTPDKVRPMFFIHLSIKLNVLSIHMKHDMFIPMIKNTGPVPDKARPMFFLHLCIHLIILSLKIKVDFFVPRPDKA